MRIGLFSDTYSPDINGVVSSIITLQEALIEQGHDVFVITTRHGHLSLSYENNILRLPGVEVKKMYGYTLTSPVHLRAYSIIKDMKLDIIHVHTEFGVGVFGHIMGKMLKLPIVSTYHTTYEDYTHYVNMFNLKSVETLAKKTVVRLSRIFGSSSIVIVAPSEKTKEMLLRYGIKREIFVVPTGLNLERFDKNKKDLKAIESFKEKAGFKDTDRIVVYVGRLAKEKSIDLVIEGFEIIGNSHPEIKLLIAGGGPSEEELKSKVKRLGLENQVKFIGKVPSDQIPAVYHLSDVFVSASLTETQGLTFIEAMASGLPVFARFDHVISDLVIDDETGHYFEDAHSMAASIIRYFMLPKEEQEWMSMKAKDLVSIYDRRNFASRIEEVYKRAQKLYHSSYVVEKVHYKDGYAKVYLSNVYEKIEYILLLESINEKGIKENMMMSNNDLEHLSEDERLALAYKECIKKLKYKDRTRKEIYDTLAEKTNLNASQMNTIVDILEKQGLVNDEKFVQSTISYYRSLLLGRNKIIDHLTKRGIPPHLIEQNMLDDDSQFELENALRLANKHKEKIHDYSVRAKKDKIIRKLVSEGYDVTTAYAIVAMLDFTQEYEYEEENCRRYATRIHKQLKAKGLKNKLGQRRKLSNALAVKGFEFELIKKIVDELEGEYDFENNKPVE